MSNVTPITEAQRLAARRASLPAALSSSQLRKRSVDRMRFVLTNLLEDNTGKVQAWLDAIEKVDGAKAAFDSFLKLLEFGVPKLSRAEVAIEDAGETKKAELSMEELQQIIREGRTIEGTAVDITEDDYSDLID